MDLLEQDWAIEFHSGIPAYRQIVNHVQAEVAAGRLKSGDQLPPIRALHRKLDVNPNTIVRAYRELGAAGVIEAVQGSGCYVSAPAAPAPLPARARKAKAAELSARVAAEAKGHGIPLDELIRQLRLQHAP